MGKININIHGASKVSLSVMKSRACSSCGIHDCSRSPLVTCIQYFINKGPFGAPEVFNLKHLKLFIPLRKSICLKCRLLPLQSCLANLELFRFDLVAGAFLSEPARSKLESVPLRASIK